MTGGERQDPGVGSRRSREERSRAFAAIIGAVGNRRDSSRNDVSVLVDAEVNARSIQDLTPVERDFLIDSIQTSPARAGWRTLSSQAVGLIRGAKRAARPRWTYPPKGVRSLTSWREDQQEIPVVLATADLPDEDRVLDRLFAELPGTVATSTDQDGRPCDVWLSPREVSAAAPIAIHVGQHEIAPLPVAYEGIAHALIRVHGGSRNAVEVLAELWGADTATGSLTVYLLDPP